MADIVVLDGYTVNPGDNSWAALAELGTLTVYDRSSPAQIGERARTAEVVLVNKAQRGRAELHVRSIASSGLIWLEPT